MLVASALKVEVKPALCNLEWAEGAMALPTGEAVRVRFDFSHPEVRAYHLAFVRELFERYDGKIGDSGCHQIRALAGLRVV